MCYVVHNGLTNKEAWFLGSNYSQDIQGLNVIRKNAVTEPNHEHSQEEGSKECVITKKQFGIKDDFIKIQQAPEHLRLP